MLLFPEPEVLNLLLLGPEVPRFITRTWSSEFINYWSLKLPDFYLLIPEPAVLNLLSRTLLLCNLFFCILFNFKQFTFPHLFIYMLLWYWPCQPTRTCSSGFTLSHLFIFMLLWDWLCQPIRTCSSGFIYLFIYFSHLLLRILLYAIFI